MGPKCTTCIHQLMPLRKGIAVRCRLEVLQGLPCKYEERFMVPDGWHEEQAKRKKGKRR